MCSLDGRSGTNTGAIPGKVKRASLEGSTRWVVLAWDKSASRRAQGWAGEKVARSKGQLWPLQCFPSMGEALENRVRALTLRPLRSRLTGNIGGELWS